MVLQIAPNAGNLLMKFKT